MSDEHDDPHGWRVTARDEFLGDARPLAVPDPADTPEERTRRAFAHPARNAFRARLDGTCLAGGFATSAFVGYDDHGIYVELSVRCETCGTALVLEAPPTTGGTRELGVTDTWGKVLNIPVRRFATHQDEPEFAAAVVQAREQREEAERREAETEVVAVTRFVPDDDDIVMEDPT